MFTTTYNQKLNTSFLTIVLIFWSLLSTASVGEKEAKKLFDKEQFAEALPYYEQLYTLYPNDVDIQYAYGVCMTETGDYSAKTKKLLLLASLNDAPVKVYYYIGKIYHATNEFDTALDYYNRFEEKSTAKVLRKMNLDELKSQCQQNKNPFEEILSINKSQNQQTVEIPVDETPEAQTSGNTKNLNSETNNAPNHPKAEAEDAIVEPDKVSVVKDSTSMSPEIHETAGPAETGVAVHLPELSFENPIETATPVAIELPENLMDTILNYSVSSSVKYLKLEQFRTKEGQKHFVDGWKAQKLLEAKTKKLSALRNNYIKLETAEEKQELAAEILDLELELPEIKQESDKAFLTALEEELHYWQSARAEEILKLQQENESILQTLQPKKEEEEEEAPTVSEIEVIDSVVSNPPATEKIETEVETETEEDENNLIYRIQIGAYSKGLPEYVDRLYKKLSVLRKIDHYTDDRGVTVYTVGEVNNFDDALKLQAQIRQEGVKDAFVVAYNNGKRITLKEARELTQE